MPCACCECVQVRLVVCCNRQRAFAGGAVIVDSCQVTELGTWNTTANKALAFDFIGETSDEFPNGRCSYTVYQPEEWPPPWDIFNPNIGPQNDACDFKDDGIVYRISQPPFSPSEAECGTWVPKDPFPPVTDPVTVCADDWSGYDPNVAPPP